MHFPGTPLRWLDLLVGGILYGYLFIKAGRLWAPIGCHIMFNFFVSQVFGIGVEGTEVTPIFITVLTGPDGVNNIIKILAALLCLLYVHFFVKNPKQIFWSMDSDLPLRRGMNALN